jgi:hypothetical protein
MAWLLRLFTAPARFTAPFTLICQYRNREELSAAEPESVLAKRWGAVGVDVAVSPEHE